MLEQGLLEPHPGGSRLAATFEEAAGWSIMNGTDLGRSTVNHADDTPELAAILRLIDLQGLPTGSSALVSLADLMNATDLEMGSTIWTTHMESAVKQGLATEAAVSRALRRGLRNQFVAGRFLAGRALCVL